MRDLAIEIWESIRRNKLRTCLTGLAVSWGIFMLIVLLGAGNGLTNMMDESSGDIQVNTMMVWGGYTSKPYDGLGQDRRIDLDSRDLELTRSPLFADHIDEVTASLSTGSMTVSLGDRHFNSAFSGVFPQTASINKLELYAGRFINDKDIAENRKVMVLDSKRASTLLRGSQNYESIIGRRVKAGGFIFRVVGVYKSDESSMAGSIFLPYTTVRTIFLKGDNTINDGITFTFHGLESEEANEVFEAEYRAVLNRNHRAAPDDTRAISIWNQFTQSLQINKAQRIINTALWIVGLFTLLSGIVGVSNIMLITVKERTHEFGIRKAIGAAPSAIIRLIIAESVSITAVFGYIGMALGMIACYLMDKVLGSSQSVVLGQEVNVLVNPTVGLDVAMEATLVLIVAGTLAGLMPALKAARVRPIEALRAD